jgi:predicted  nucleic acid-binding Zn-ribbon protein
MNQEIKNVLAYQEVDTKLFTAEKAYMQNADVIKFAKARKKGETMQETLSAFENKAQGLLERFHALGTEKDSLVEEKTQIEKSVEECEDQVGAEYLKTQTNLIIAKIEKLKTAMEELSQEMNAVCSEYMAYAKEIKEAKVVVSELKDTYKTLTEEFKKTRDEVQAELVKMESGLSGEFLEKYKTRRKDKKITLPLVKDCDAEFCSHCYQELSQSLKGKLGQGELVECDNCHKFLYSGK